METELSFLLTLLLEHRLSKGTKALVRDRVKAIQGQQPQRPINQMVTSTPTAAPPADIFSAPLPPRVVGGEVSTGAGTKGPRKW